MNSATLILRILTFSLLISFNFSLYSQATPKVDLSVLKNKLPPSPTAAALGQYGEVPVSLYNGMPQVNVPITQLSGNDMTMPISLSYHASGNKVNQIASWVGLGFSLNAGGVITREIRDQPDDVFKFKPTIFHCMFPCLNCADCSSNIPETVSTICDYCNQFLDLKYDFSDVGYLYSRNKVIELYNKPVNDYTIDERLWILGRTFDTVHVRQLGFVDDNTKFIIDDNITKEVNGFNYQFYALLRPKIDAYDSEADIFNFNFNGYTGQFIFDKDGIAKVLSNDDLKIEYTISPTQNIMAEYSAIGMTSAFEGGITEFKITTPDGSTYIFNQKEITHSDSEGQDNGSSEYGTYSDCNPQLKRPYQTPLFKRRAAYTAWYLSKIYNPMGQLAFDLEYDKEIMIDHSNINQSKSEGASSQPYSKSSSVVTTFGKRLKKIKSYTIVEGINSLTGCAEFEPASTERIDLYYPTWLIDKMGTAFSKSKALDKIILRGTDETVNLKEFAFNYGSFQKVLDSGCSVTPDYVNKHAERLKLLSVTETGKFGGTTSVEPFSFEYDETPLPPRHSPHQDFWGYYNGPTKTQSLLPKLYAYPNFIYNSATVTNFQTIYSIFHRYNIGALNTDYFILNQPTGYNLANDRTPTFDSTKAGILKKINYPTGGNVVFDYEEHKFSMDNFMDVTAYSAGGVRIKTITNSGGVTKNYKYTKTISGAEYTTGKLVQLPNFGQCKYSPAGGIDNAAKIKNSTTISSNSNFNTSNGSAHVGYEQVTEVETQNGKTIYYYNTPAILGTTQHSENSTVLFKYPEVWRNYEGPFYDLNPFAPVPNYDWNRGLLLKKEIYTEGGTTPIQVTTNTYKLVKFEKIPSIKAQTLATSPGNDWNPLNSIDVLALAKYYTLVADKRLETVTVRENYGANFIETLTTYGYGNNHKNPISTTITNSNAKVYKTEVVYSKDLPTSTDPAIIKLNDYNIITPIETKLLVDNVLQGGIKNEFANYTVVAKTIPLQKKWIEILKDNTLDEKAEVESYNIDGRLTKWKQSFFTTSEELKWGTTTGLLEEKKFGTLISKVTYHPNIRAVRTLTNENGQTTSFVYDPLLRLQTTQMKFDNPDPTVLSNPKVITSIAYNFGGTTAPTNNFVTTSTNFSDYYTANQTTKQYFDGLGRPISTVRENYTPNNYHQKSNITYDAIGRQDRAYQPFEGTQTGYEAIDPSVARNVKPYINPEYEASPLSRPIKQFTEEGTFMKIEYGTNNANYLVRQFTVTAGTNGNFYTLSPVTTNAGNYSDNALYRITTWDENANTNEPKKGRVDIFKDKIGRVVLTRKFVKDANNVYKDVDTYNIYDDYSNLIMVIPPDVLDGNGNISAYSLIFQYKYDNQNRLCSKLIPGADAQELYYDNRDLVVLTQDGIQRIQNKLLATLYDVLGRPIKTGFVPTTTTGSTRSAIESYINTNNGIPASAITDILTETSFVPNRSLVSQTKAKILGFKKAGDADFAITNYEYDAYARMNGTTGNAHLNKYTSTYFPQNNADKPTANFHSWIGPDDQYKASLQYNYYDNGLRPSSTYHSIVLDNTWSNITYSRLVSNLKYDEKDRMIEKNLGGIFDWNTWSMKYLQSIDYKYNNRNWLTTINEGYLPQTSLYAVPYPIATCEEISYWCGSGYYFTPGLHVGDQNPDLFAEVLRYDNPIAAYPGSTPARYNGDISQVVWQIAGRESQVYSYGYDELNRMIDANYTDIRDAFCWNTNSQQTYSLDNKYQEKVKYKDARGNIEKITRRGLDHPESNSGVWCGVYNIIDDLTFNYNSKNQITTVAEAAPSWTAHKGFKYNASAGAYMYDENGNLKKDDHKNITAIEYNYLNLPVKVTFTNNRTIEFTYDATGKKWRKVVKEAGQLDKERDYIDGVEYSTVGTTISQDIIHFTEGYAQRDPSTDGNPSWQGWVYNYAIKDHLGNTRVVFDDFDNDGNVTTQNVKQPNNYYPFGMNMEGNWSGADGQFKYQYNGKEWNDKEFSDGVTGLGWNDYGKRWYDPTSNRFWTGDALAIKFPFYSPYQFAGNKVPNAIDLDGLEELILNRLPPQQFQYFINNPNGRSQQTGNIIPIDATSFEISGTRQNNDLQFANGGDVTTNRFLINNVDGQTPRNVTSSRTTDADPDVNALLMFGNRTTFPRATNQYLNANMIGQEFKNSQRVNYQGFIKTTGLVNSDNTRTIGQIATGLLNNLQNAVDGNDVVYNVQVFFPSVAAQDANLNIISAAITQLFPNATIQPVVNRDRLTRGLRANGQPVMVDANGNLIATAIRITALSQDGN